MTTYEKIYDLFALVNLIMCLAIFWLCLCKLNTKLSKQYLRIRFKFTVLLVGSIASGLQPILWESYPNVGQCIFSLSLVIYLYMNKFSYIKK